MARHGVALLGALALTASAPVSGARVLQQAGNGNALVAGTPGAAYSYQAVVPVSYFNNYVGTGMANAPYTVSFSTGKVYNGGTAYYIGNMATPTEQFNTFTIPVTGGAGPCPNGAMRSGSLSVTCGASSTSFNVVENPMCTYAMTFVTTQACPSPVPASYFNNYVGQNVANAPYTLSFSTGKAYNGGTAYYIGSMAWPSETGNTFTIPITGGAGPCPNGAMRSGTLQVTCGASSTSFNVVENPMCTYAMTYVTTQACPSPVPVSYFSNYQGLGMANAPYTLSFSTAKVYNGGTAYYIGSMAWPSEVGNTFTIPVTGGAGPCPNGAMRSGVLTLTCSASSTTFNVVENPMCTYAMTYTTTQPCPNYIAPSPPPPSVQPGGWSYQGCFNDASARTLPVLLSTSANVQQCQALGRSGGYNVVGAEWFGECWACNGCNYQSAGRTNTCSTSGTFGSWSSNGMPAGAGWALAVYTLPPPPPPPPSPSPPPPPTVYTTQHVLDNSVTQPFQNRVTGPGNNNPHVLNGGATSTSTESTASGVVNVWEDTSTTLASQRGSGNGHTLSQSTTTDTTDTGHPVTNIVHNSPPPSPSPPPPTVYQTREIEDHARSSNFAGRQTGGPTEHVLNNGATTTSTDTTVSGNVNAFITTSTTDATQEGSGNGHVLNQATTTSTTDQGHQVVRVQHNTHPSTTDLTTDSATPAATPAAAPAAAAALGLCSGGAFAVADVAKNLCLHVKGTGSAGAFQLANVKRPVITMACDASSPNQQFTWTPSAVGGVLVHSASQMALSLTSSTVVDGSTVTVLPNTGSAEQAWIWDDATSGGTISAAVDEHFEITDSRVNAGANIGLPVHMWHLQASLPSGSPNAAWLADCSN